MECIDRCQFQRFQGKKFLCELYEDKLVCFKENGNVAVIRCKQCIEEHVEYEIAQKVFSDDS